MSLSISASWT